MLENVKEILLLQIKDEIEEYEKARDRISEIEKREKELYVILYGPPLSLGDDDLASDSIDVDGDIEVLAKPTRPLLNNKHYSFFEKYIFKRKEYLSMQKHNRELQEKYQKELDEYNKKAEQYQKEIQKLAEEKIGLTEICGSKEEIKEEFEQIKSATTLKGLGLTVKDAMDLLQKNETKFVLEESDKTITNNNSDFDKKEDFVLIHKTFYSPTGDQVRSSLNKGAKSVKTVYFRDEKFSYEYSLSRDTIHLCQNGEVSSHIYGNFEGRRYAVILPFKSVDTSNMCSFSPEDTYFEGSVDTQGGYILCPENEVDIVQKNNPNTTVIGYKGECVDGYADAFISMLGYRHETITQHSWASEVDMQKHGKFVENSGGKIKYGWHAGSEEYGRDQLVGYYSKIIGFVSSIKQYSEKGKKFNPDELIYELFNCDNKVSIINGVEELEEENGLTIAPSVTFMMGYSSHYGKKLFLQECLKEGSGAVSKDSEESNLIFLVSKLQNDFDININPETIKVLGYTEKGLNFDKDVQEICGYISDEGTKNLIVTMVNDGKISTLNQVKDVVFLKNVVEQTYRLDKVAIDHKDEKAK